MKLLTLTPLLMSAVFAPLAAQTVPFHTPVQYQAGSGPLSIAAADFTGDGKVDLTVANSAGDGVTLFVGKGDGSFTDQSEFPLPSGCIPSYLAAADFNHDGNPDILAVCIGTNAVVVLPGMGNGSFGKPVETALPQTPLAGYFLFVRFQPAVADFNGDGYPDLVLALTPDLTKATTVQLYLMLGNGDGHFQAPTLLAGASGALSFVAATGDFNGDGKLDLAVAQSSLSTNVLSILLGDGRGGFQSQQASVPALVESLAFDLVSADVNGDGILDLIETGIPPAYFTDDQKTVPPTTVAVLVGHGDGTFTQTSTFTEPGIIPAMFALPISGTGPNDLIELLITGVGDEPSSSVSVRENQGQGTFGPLTTVTTFPNGLVTWSAATADFTGSGLPDLALTALSLDSSPSESKGFFSSLPSGSLYTLLNTSPPLPPLSFSNANGASFVSGPLAANSIASAFGAGIAPSPAPVLASVVPLPTSLGGVSLAVTDSAGTSRPAPLFYVSPTQINYAIPAGTASGAATVAISGNARAYASQITIAQVAPGLFNVGGLAAGSAVTMVNGQQQSASLVNCPATGCTTVPVDVSGGQTFLVLYGTGIRGYSKGVTATIGSATVTPVYAGPQGVYVGEDQINIQLPASLAGAGEVSVTLTVDGQPSNAVKVQIE